MHKEQEEIGIPSLELHHQTFSDSQSKANILNDQFSSDDHVKDLDGVPYPNLPSIDVDVDGVTCKLQPHKAPGPDGRLLRDMATSIAPILTSGILEAG